MPSSEAIVTILSASPLTSAISVLNSCPDFLFSAKTLLVIAINTIVSAIIKNIKIFLFFYYS